MVVMAASRGLRTWSLMILLLAIMSVYSFDGVSLAVFFCYDSFMSNDHFAVALLPQQANDIFNNLVVAVLSGNLFFHHAAVLLVALLVDFFIGDPVMVYKRLAHPVVVMGKWLLWLEQKLYPSSSHDRGRQLGLTHPAAKTHHKGKKAVTSDVIFFMRGCLFLLLAIAPFLIFFFLPIAFSGDFSGWLYTWPFYPLVFLLIEVLLVAILLATNSLIRHVRAVARDLERSTSAGQRSLQKIVSRDATKLDKYGVARSALESLSENFSDGVVAPAFYYFFFGLPGLLIYKMVNTADSMVGYRNERYEWFGKAVARVDDLLNFVPARFSALLYLVAGAVLAPRRLLAAVGVLWRDAAKHASPNSGWPEAALAGLLAVKIGGKRFYPGGIVKKQYIGAGRERVNARDIDKGINLTLLAFLSLWLTILVILLMVK